MKKIALTLIVGVGAMSASAQTSRLKYADRQYNQMAYYYAAEAYEDVLERGVDSLQVSSKIADSYDKTDNVNKATEWFSFIERKGALTQEQHLRLALLKREQKDYLGSLKLLETYEQKYGATDVTRSMISENHRLETLKTSNENFVLKLQNVNTKASEIGTTYYQDNQVLLTSSKRKNVAVKQLHSWTGNHYYNLYRTSTSGNGDLSKMKRIRGAINTKFHDGPASYDSVNHYLYFTRDNYLKGHKGTDANKVVRLKIYRAQLKGNRMKNVEELPFNSSEYSCGHPSISADGKTLYFASDKPGGFGGTDLYQVSVNENGTFGNPVNLGNTVNSTQDELFPYIHPVEQLLFFSSYGHNGLGGLDVFVAKLSNTGSFRAIENLGAPINSEHDDFSFVNNADQTSGYLASNRDGGKGDDDIYSFSQLKAYKNAPVLSGNTSDILAGTDLENVLIFLKDKRGNIVDTVRSKPNGDFEFDMEAIADDFYLVAEKDGYLQAAKNVDFDPEKDEYKEELQLMPDFDYHLAGIVRDEHTSALVPNVKVTILDRRTHETISPLKTDASGKFITDNLNYEYGNTVDYDVLFEKDGYFSKTVNLTEVLAKKEELLVNGELGILLDPIKAGVDLAEKLNLAPIYFDYTKFNIRPDAAIELDKIVKIMNEHPTMTIELGSHTDCRGSKAANQSLSQKRAKASADYIKARITNPSRIYGKGYGETKLKNGCACEGAVKSTCSEEEHQQNRRTEFIILKM